jgi:hypothetical protein
MQPIQRHLTATVQPHHLHNQRLKIQLRFGEHQPGYFLDQPPPGLLCLAQGDRIGDQRTRLGLTRQGTGDLFHQQQHPDYVAGVNNICLLR